jgi:uncharacterized protein (UPF0264 family)
MAELLVSVRSVAEAAAALAGGAALIDVKEPRHGSLGRAADSTIRAIRSRVGDRRPVSAALGELVDRPAPLPDVELTYAKWGLSRCLDLSDWPVRLLRTAQQQGRRQAVAVSYVDWRLARAPRPGDLCDFACRHGWGVLLLDTWKKNGPTLLDWLCVAEIDRFCRRCRQAGVRVALAGSLGPVEIQRLQEVQPDWFAVRGAVCRKNCRTNAVDAGRVRSLVQLLQCGPTSSGCPGPDQSRPLFVEG